MTSGPTSMRLGDLLVELDLIQLGALEEAMQVAIETGLPLGRILIMSSHVTEAQLQAVVQAQSLLKDGLLAKEMARKAIEMVSKSNGTLKQALNELGWEQHETQQTNKLGQLLVEAGVIDKESLDTSMTASAQTGLPLGRLLVLRGMVSDELLSSALTAQVFVRDGKISRDQAVQGLKAALQRQVTIEQSLADHGFYKPPRKQKIRLGELFVIAGLLDEKDVINALEVGLLREQPVGEVLVYNGLINKHMLQVAIRLQEMVDNGTLNVLQASHVLSRVVESGTSIAQAVAELGLLKPSSEERLRLGELLKMAGLVSDKEMQDAVRVALDNSSIVGKILLINGLIDEPMLHASLRCQFLLREGFLKQEQAIVALNYCQKRHCSFDDAIQELGWTVPTRIVPAQKEMAADNI